MFLGWQRLDHLSEDSPYNTAITDHPKAAITAANPMSVCIDGIIVGTPVERYEAIDFVHRFQSFLFDFRALAVSDFRWRRHSRFASIMRSSLNFALAAGVGRLASYLSCMSNLSICSCWSGVPVEGSDPLPDLPPVPDTARAPLARRRWESFLLDTAIEGCSAPSRNSKTPSIVIPRAPLGWGGTRRFDSARFFLTTLLSQNL